MSELRRLIRAFLLLNVVIICVGAVAVGAIIAAENTKKTVGAGAVFVNAGTTVRDKYVPMQMKSEPESVSRPGAEDRGVFRQEAEDSGGFVRKPESEDFFRSGT